jgi:hypothetical protein
VICGSQPDAAQTDIYDITDIGGFTGRSDPEGEWVTHTPSAKNSPLQPQIDRPIVGLSGLAARRAALEALLRAS